MSFAVDVNILLYTSNTASGLHEKAAAILARGTRGPDVCCLAWVTVTSYLRIATHGRIFEAPLTHAEALANVDASRSLLHCRAIGEAWDFCRTYRQVSAEVPRRTNGSPMRIWPPSRGPTE